MPKGLPNLNNTSAAPPAVVVTADHKNSGNAAAAATGDGGAAAVGDAGRVKMAVWEHKMRLDLADIQKKYKEKYKELYKLQHKTTVTSSSAKKANNLSSPSSKGQNHQRPNAAPLPAKKTLAPISPWLQTFKVKMNGQNGVGEKSSEISVKSTLHQKSENQQRVQPEKVPDTSDLHNGNGKKSMTTNGARGEPHGPDLSTITTKFRSARPSPFENLLKLSCMGKKSQDGVKKTEEEDGNEVSVLPSNDGKISIPRTESIDDQVSYPHLATSTPKVSAAAIVVNNKKPPKAKKKSQKEAFLLQDDLNKPLPKLHLASNNNIDDHGDADISEEEDDERGSPPVLEPMTTLINSEGQKNNITVKIKRPSSSETDKTAASSEFEVETASQPRSPKVKKSKKEKKAKKSKKERHRGEGDHHHHHHHKKHHKKPIVHVNDDSKAPADCIDLTNKTGSFIASSEAAAEISQKFGLKPDHRPQDPPPTGTPRAPSSLCPPAGPLHTTGPQLCVIKETDLVDGLRVLVKLEGHFHPGKIQAISPPDIYGVLVDKERGNKPHIFSREEVLREAIFEVKATKMSNLPIGTRVCAYWSQKYHHLYPGTISDMEIDRKLDAKKYVNVELDDGDNRDIDVDSIRFLPTNYPLVVYDPDPLMSVSSRRKRRHSWESGTSEGSRAMKTPRASIDSEISPPPSMVASMPQKNHVHAGDLKMRIHVGNSQSKQRKSSGGGNGYTTTGNNANGGPPAHFATSKSGRKASLAQRPSISSVRISY
jgi:hypothetical protein